MAGLWTSRFFLYFFDDSFVMQTQNENPSCWCLLKGGVYLEDAKMINDNSVDLAEMIGCGCKWRGERSGKGHNNVRGVGKENESNESSLIILFILGGSMRKYEEQKSNNKRIKNPE